jgi:hypothetical protein
MLLYVDEIFTTYPFTEAATIAAIEINTIFSENYNITNLDPLRQFFGTEIHQNMGGIGINLSQKDFITTIHNNSA